MDTVIREINARWGLGEQGRPLVQMLVSYMANPATGGLNGFLDKFRQAGLGGMVASWLGTSAQRDLPTTTQINDILGGRGGVVEQITKRLGLSTDKILGAIAALLPTLIARMTPDGKVPAVLPAEFASMAREGHTLLTTGASAATAASMAPAAAPAAASSGVGKWLPWVIGALVVIFGLSYCNKERNTVASSDSAPTAAVTPAPAPTPTPAPAVTPAPTTTVEPVTPAPAAVVPNDSASSSAMAPAPAADNTVLISAPEGAGVMEDMLDGMPVLRVFFDTGKTEVASAFASKSTALVEFLKSNPDVKAMVSGFNDSTGDAARNAELSKQRAQAVKSALESAGVAADRVVLEKPAETDGTGVTNAASRRVDVMLRR